MKAIGLKRLTVRLEQHNPKWKSAYEVEARKLRKLFPNTEHIGSTSIKGIKAKPIIDMLVGVTSIKEAKKFINPLKKLGYMLRPNASNSKKLFFVKGMESNRTHYLHMVKYNGGIWNNDIFFRDYLNQNKQAAKAYEQLKITLANKFANTRPKYTKAKRTFIKQVLAKRKL